MQAPIFEIPSAAHYPLHLNANGQLRRSAELVFEYLRSLCVPSKSQAFSREFPACPPGSGLDELDMLRARTDDIDTEMRETGSYSEILSTVLATVTAAHTKLLAERERLQQRANELATSRSKIQLPFEILASICKRTYWTIRDTFPRTSYHDKPMSNECSLWRQVCYDSLTSTMTLPPERHGRYHADKPEDFGEDLKYCRHANLEINLLPGGDKEYEIIPDILRVLAFRKRWLELEVHLKKHSGSVAEVLYHCSQIIPTLHHISIIDKDDTASNNGKWWTTEFVRGPQLHSAEVSLIFLEGSGRLFESISYLTICVLMRVENSPTFWDFMQGLKQLKGLEVIGPCLYWDQPDLRPLFPSNAVAYLPGLKSLSFSELGPSAIQLFFYGLGCQEITHVAMHWYRFKDVSREDIMDLLNVIDARCPGLISLSFAPHNRFGFRRGLVDTSPPEWLYLVLSEPDHHGLWLFPHLEELSINGGLVHQSLTTMLRSRYADPSVSSLRVLKMCKSRYQERHKPVSHDWVADRPGLYVQDVISCEH